MKIQFELGEGIYFRGPVNLLINQRETGFPPKSIYAECPVSEDVSDYYGYITMKKAILQEMEKRNLKINNLEFWYDGQEQFLPSDASADCEVYVEIDVDE